MSKRRSDQNVFLSILYDLFGWMGRAIGVILAGGIAGGILGGGIGLFYGAPLALSAGAGAVVGVALALVILYMILDAW